MPTPKKTSLKVEQSQSLNLQEIDHLHRQEAQVKSPYFKIAIASFLFVLLYRLFPYDVTLSGDFSPDFIISQFTQDGLTGLKDYIELFISLVIFALFSFGLTGVLHQRRLPALALFSCIMLVGVSLSAVMEIAQAFLSSRNPNLSDVLSDSMGLIVGGVSYYKWRVQWFQLVASGQQWFQQVLRKNLSFPVVATLFVGYLLVANLGFVFLLSTDFSNWSSSYSLNIGNEGTGDRPWEGRVSQVQLFDQAASPDDVTSLLSDKLPQSLNSGARLAAYTFNQEQTNFLDQTGQSPALAWRGAAVNPSDNGIPISSKHWLRTIDPVTTVNQRIQSTVQLTLDVTIAPDHLKQTGPARIVSVSENATERNFTLGQEGKSLVFRLRTPLTGTNGANPQITIPNVFTNNSPHHVVVTYGNAVLQIYIDTIDNLHTFPIPYLGYKLLFYGLIFIPLGGLLSMILVVIPKIPFVKLGTLVLGGVIPPLFLEGLLVSTTHRSPTSANLGLSLLFMGLGFWLVHRSLYPLLKRDFRLNHRKVFSH